MKTFTQILTESWHHDQFIHHSQKAGEHEEIGINHGQQAEHESDSVLKKQHRKLYDLHDAIATAHSTLAMHHKAKHREQMDAQKPDIGGPPKNYPHPGLR
jgi:hypothetical protein